MADKDIKIGIKTTADTSGAKATEESLKDVKKAATEAAQAEPTGFGRDTAAAKRIAALEAAEATEKQAGAVKELAAATKDAAEELPALGEADIIAEGVERLGEGAADAAEKSGGLGSAVAGLAGRLNLYAAALSLGWQAAQGWINSQKALNEIAQIGVDDIDELAKSAGQAALAEEAAARGAKALENARKKAEEITRESTAAENEFHEALAETIAKEAELRKLRDEISGKQTEVALEAADGDPLAQQQIKEAARKAAQEQERKDLEADIAMQREIKEKAAAEAVRLDEQAGKARGRGAELEGQSSTQKESAEKLRAAAESAEKQRQFAIERKKKAQEQVDSFWTPTAMKNIAKDIIADETENAEEFEKRREALKNRATELEKIAEANDELAKAEKKAAENHQNQRDGINGTYQKASKEEERLTGIVAPHMAERQALEDAKAGASESNFRKREDEKRKAEEAKRKEEEDRRRLPVLKDEIEGRAGAFENRVLNSPVARNGPNKDLAQDLGKAIGDADKSSEMNQILEQIKGLGGPQIALMREFLQSQLAMAREMENIKERLRKLP